MNRSYKQRTRKCCVILYTYFQAFLTLLGIQICDQNVQFYITGFILGLKNANAFIFALETF